MSGSASETSPLLHTPTAVSQRHRLAPPAIRFPGHEDGAGWERQQSYGFSRSNLEESSTSDATLVDGVGDHRQHGLKRPRDPRLQPTREDSKTYTSFPVPTGTPWREPGTPMDQREYPFFTRLFGNKSTSNDTTEYSYIQDEERGHADRQPGLPKVSRDCLIAEIKCYGKYILPTVLVFVVLVLVIALGLFYHYRD